MTDSCVVNQSETLLHRAYLPWFVCLSAGLFFFYEFFQLNLFDVINQPLRAAFHINAAQLSWMSSTYIWANVLFLLPAGVILDRYSTRAIILMAMFICVVGTLGFALTESFLWGAFFHSLTGAGNAFCFLSCVVLVSRWFPPRRQALVLGCIVTLAFIGGMVAHTPLVYLNEHFGWRHALLIDSAFGVIIFFWIYFTVQNNSRVEVRHPHQRNIWADFSAAFKNKQNWLAGFYTSCLNLPIMVLCALWGASYLKIVHHLNEMTASNIISLVFLGSIFGCPLVGWMSDSLGRRKPIMIAGAIATLLCLLPLFMASALSEWSLGFIFFALGFFTSAQVVGYPLIAESNSSANTGAATGFASVIIMGGGGVGQVLFGLLMQHHAGVVNHSYSAVDFQFAMWMFPISILMALVVIILARETYCKRYD